VAILLQEKPTVELTTPPTVHTYSLYKCFTMHKLMHFYYACLNHPVVSTFIKAIKARYLQRGPGLTAERIRRHINISVESKQGHMNQVWQGQRSTQPTSATALIVCVCVCVNLTSGALSLSPPVDYRVPGAVLSAHLSTAVNKIKDATLTSPGVLGRLRTLLHPTAPRKIVQLVLLANLEVVVLVLVCDNCRAWRPLLREGPNAPLSCRVQVRWLVPPKRLNRRTPLPHCSHAELIDWSIDDEVCNSLSMHIHIMGNCLQTGCLQHIRQVRVRP
jgi:hypothetical protein